MPRTMYAAGLAWLFGQLRAAFDQEAVEAVVEARAAARDGHLGTKPAWAVRGTLPCLVRPLRAEAREIQGRDAAKVWVQAFFLSDPGAAVGDRLRVGDALYSIVETIDQSHAGGMYRVDCTETRG